MHRTAIIVGIDPGTTTSYAVLDLSGRILKIKSGKNLDLSKIITETSSVGYPLVVGTDKAKIPATVEKYAIQMRARLIQPQQDLRLEDKSKLTEQYKTHNRHEKDALASALNAYSSLRSLLAKLQDIKVASEIKNKVLKSVIVDKIAISKAIAMHTEKEEEKPKEEIVQHQEKSPEQLKEEIENLRKENTYLKKYSVKLASQIKKISRPKKVNIVSPDQRLEEKENLINTLRKIIYGEKAIGEQLRKENAKLENLIVEANKPENLLAKKLKNLTWQEYEKKNKILKISGNDILYVNDISQFSERTISQLQEKISIVITDIPNIKLEAKMPFTVVHSPGLIKRKNNNFAIIDREALQQSIKDKNIIERVVESYRSGR